jgi:hypothetical protein
MLIVYLTRVMVDSVMQIGNQGRRRTRGSSEGVERTGVSVAAGTVFG